MSSDAPESAQHAVSELLYIDILLVCAQMIACNTEWRSFNRNLSEEVVLDVACFVVARCFCRRVLRFSLAPYVVF